MKITEQTNKKFYCGKRALAIKTGSSKLQCEKTNSCEGCKYKTYLDQEKGQSEMAKELNKIADLVNPNRRLSAAPYEIKMINQYVR